ncbi:hypothetical protein [Streptomyces sp. NPDC006193]|uniref:hypothetical protein n=1 Tax=Streptomyces sp. NPDC006193 TaxID=3155717 RepID=UPI0033B3EF18
MPDRTSDERDPTGRSTQGDEWVPGARTPREPRPEERLPGEPAPAGSTAGPGREGPAGDGRTLQDTPRHSEGQRPGAEATGRETPGAPAGDDRPAPHAGPATGGRDDGTADADGIRGDRTPGREEGRVPPDGPGAPHAGDAGRETGTTGTGAHAPGTASSADPLLPHEEAERWERLMREVAAGFVDEPRKAVEEADRALEEIAVRFSEAVTRRRRALRGSWEDAGDDGLGAGSDTERLRLALRDYRELAGRLLHG